MFKISAVAIMLAAAFGFTSSPNVSAGVNQWTPYGSGLWGGGVGSVALARDQNVFAGLENNLYRSRDGGASWAKLKFDIEHHYAAQVAVTANDPESVWIVDTGGTVRHSADGGASWQVVSAPAASSPSGTALWAHPENPAWAVLVRNGVGIFVTADAGRSWQQTLGPYSGRLAAGETPATLYSAGWLHPGGTSTFLVSRDAGLTWTTVAVGSEVAFSPLRGSNDAFKVDRLGGAVYGFYPAGHPRYSQTVVAYRSVDGGKTWNKLTGLPANVSAIEPSALTAGVLYAATTDGLIFRSADAGDTWSKVGEHSAFRGEPCNSLIAQARDGRDTLLASNLFETFLSPDGGTTWQAAGPGLAGAWAVSAFTEMPSGTLYASRRHALFKSQDRGRSWLTLPVGAMPFGTRLDGAALAESNGKAALLVPETGLCCNGNPNRLLKFAASGDDGKTWSIGGAALPFGENDHVLFFSGTRLPRKVFALSQPGSSMSKRSIDVSGDEGLSWQPAVPDSSNGYSGLAVGPGSGQLVVAFKYLGDALLSRDGGQTWATPTGLATARSGQAYFAKDSDQVIYLTQNLQMRTADNAGIYVSHDQGTSFRKLMNGLDPLGEAFEGNRFLGSLSQRAPKEVLLGVANGPVWRSLDGGEAWQPLPGVPFGTLTGGASSVLGLVRVDDNRDEWLALAANGVYHLEIAPQNGWWWNPQESGRGFGIERYGDRVFIAGYIYTADGQPLWFTANAELKGDVFEAPMQTFRSGQTLDGPYRVPVAGESLGTLKMKFTSATRAELSWPGGSMQVERFPFGPQGPLTPQKRGDPENGWYWNPEESGRGFMVEVQGDSAFIGSFMYDTNGQPVWYVAIAKRSGSASFDGSWMRYANGQPLTGPYRPPQVANGAVADFKIEFSGGTAQLTMSNGKKVALQRFRQF